MPNWSKRFKLVSCIVVHGTCAVRFRTPKALLRKSWANMGGVWDFNVTHGNFVGCLVD